MQETRAKIVAKVDLDLLQQSGRFRQEVKQTAKGKRKEQREKTAQES